MVSEADWIVPGLPAADPHSAAVIAAHRRIWPGKLSSLAARVPGLAAQPRSLASHLNRGSRTEAGGAGCRRGDEDRTRPGRAEPGELRRAGPARWDARHRLAIHAPELRGADRRPGADPPGHHGRLGRGQRLCRRPDPPVRRARAARLVRRLRRAGRDRVRAGAGHVAGVPRLDPARCGRRDDGRGAEYRHRPVRAPSAAEPPARRVRGGDDDRAAAGHRGHRAVVLASRLRRPRPHGPGDRGLVAGAAAARAGAARAGPGPVRGRGRLGWPGRGTPAPKRGVVPAPVIVRGRGRDGDLLPLHRRRGGSRPVGGEFLPRASGPVRLGRRDRHVRFLGRPDRRPDRAGAAAPAAAAVHGRLVGERGRRGGHGGDLVAAGYARNTGRFLGARSRAGRGVPGPDRADPGPDRPGPRPARHRLAGRRGGGRRIWPFGAHRAADRPRRAERPRPVPDRPGGPAGRRHYRPRTRRSHAGGRR